jgi:hypothetical protein
MNKKESALDLAKFIDKGVRVKLAGGREGAHSYVVAAADVDGGKSNKMFLCSCS